MRKKKKKKNSFKILIKLVFLISLVFIISSLLFKKDNFMKIIYKNDYDEYVQKYAKEYDIDPYLIHSVIHVESDHDPEAISNRGAIGLMQIMEETGIWISKNIGSKFEKKMLYEPENNIKLGAWLLNYLINNYNGNIETALAAYNGGIGNVDEWLKSDEYSIDGETLNTIPFKETEKYVEKVNKAYEKYLELYSK